MDWIDRVKDEFPPESPAKRGGTIASLGCSDIKCLLVWLPNICAILTRLWQLHGNSTKPAVAGIDTGFKVASPCTISTNSTPTD